MNKYKGIAYALLSSTAFGVMPILARIAYTNGSNPTTVLMFRFLISTLILYIYLKFSHININLKKEQTLLLIFIGITGYTITTQALFMSYNYLGAGLATTLHFIYPVVVCIASFIFFKNKLSNKKTFDGYPLKVEYFLTEHGIRILDALTIMQQVGIELMKESGMEDELKKKGFI